MLDRFDPAVRKRFLEYLKDKNTVSTPMIQRDMNLKYIPAREIIEELQGMSFISQNYVGITYDVNTRLVNARVLDREELEEAALYLDDIRLTFLDKVIRREDTIFAKDLEPIDEDDSVYSVFIEEMLEHGYIHRFDGRLFVSVSRESIEVIKTGKKVLNRDKTIAHIGYPILKYCIDHDEEPDSRLMDSPFMPKNCRKYIECGYRMYKEDGRIPKKLVVPRLDSEDKSLKSEIISAFLSQCKATTQFNYFFEAKKAHRFIFMSPACSEDYKNASMEAGKDIGAMSFDKIKELKEMVKSYCDDNEELDEREQDDIDKVTAILFGDDNDDDDDDFDFD